MPPHNSESQHHDDQDDNRIGNLGGHCRNGKHLQRRELGSGRSNGGESRTEGVKTDPVCNREHPTDVELKDVGNATEVTKAWVARQPRL